MKKKIRNKLAKFLMDHSQYIGTKLIYRKRFGKKLDLSNPRDFNEKILWLKLFWQKKIVVETVDKYLVRKYIQKNGYNEILIPLYDIYDNENQISFEKLPNEFVLKTNNGNSTTLIVKNKELIDTSKIKEQLSYWRKENFSLAALEPQYEKIPFKILAEQLINSDSVLYDYKFFCFNGAPQFLYVGIDGVLRDDGVLEKKTRKIYFDLDWNQMDVLNNKEDLLKEEEIPLQPRNFEEMIKIAGKLSTDIPFVRVDLYNVKGKIFFGEMTYTPTAGMAKYYKPDFLKRMGSLIELPNKKFYGYKE